MNKAILMGRITKDIELKQTASQIPYIQFTLAVDRKFKDANGKKQSDFINCVAWRQTANVISKYFSKGSMIALTGEIQTRNYDGNDGRKVYITEVIVEDFDFCGKTSPTVQAEPQAVPEITEEAEEMPFEI